MMWCVCLCGASGEWHSDAYAHYATRRTSFSEPHDEAFANLVELKANEAAEQQANGLIRRKPRASPNLDDLDGWQNDTTPARALTVYPHPSPFPLPLRRT